MRVRCAIELVGEAARLGAELKSHLLKSKNYLLSDNKAAELSERLTKLRERYAIADVLATYFQRCRLRTLWCLYAAALAAVAFLEVYMEIQRTASGNFLWLGLYLLLTLLTCGFFVWARSRRFQEKHMDYRALAEGLRVQFFWQLAGVPDNVADYYLPKHCGELEWIRQTIRTWNMEPSPEFGSSLTFDKRLEWVREHWVEDQAGFFRKKILLKERVNRRLRLAARMALSGSLLIALVQLFGHWQHRHDLHLQETAEWMMVAAFMLLAIYAVLKSLSEKLAYEPEIKQYEQMGSVFNPAALLLKGRSPRASMAVMQELGNESLAENGDWVLLHRERPLEVHRG